MCKNIANGIVKKTSSSVGNPNVLGWNNRGVPGGLWCRREDGGLFVDLSLCRA